MSPILFQQVIVVLFVIITRQVIARSVTDRNISQTLDSLLAPIRYNKRIRPDIGGSPTTVSVSMYIKSIGPVSETDEMYEMDVYFRQNWYDNRLQFHLPGLKEFSMSWLFLDKVWKPDTFFMNGKTSHLHRITSPNKFLRLRQDGSITYSMRLTIAATCKMHLRKFPMDSQRCPLIIGSYGYSSKDILYEWQPGGIGLEPGVELAQYDLVDVLTKNKQKVTREKDEFSIIQANLVLRRNVGYFVLQMYVPLSLVVCCSWVSFWIDPDAVPARVQLGVTTVLSITTIGFGGGRAALPKVSYPTALDWFIIICFAFVFGAIVEYAVINFLDKVTTDIKRILEERKKKKDSTADNKDENNSKETPSESTSQQAEVAENKTETQESKPMAPDLTELPETKKQLTEKPGTEKQLTEKPGTEKQLIELPEVEKRHVSTESSLEQKDNVRKLGIKAGGYKFEEYSSHDTRQTKHRLKKKGKNRTQRKSKLASRRSVSLPILQSNESLSSADSQDGTVSSFQLKDKNETLNIVKTFFQLDDEHQVVVEPVNKLKRGDPLRKTLLIPIRLWREIKILPNEDDVCNAVEPTEKFSKIDTVSRKIFPLTFVFVVTFYALLYTYYITDDSNIEDLSNFDIFVRSK